MALEQSGCHLRWPDSFLLPLGVFTLGMFSLAASYCEGAKPREWPAVGSERVPRPWPESTPGECGQAALSDTWPGGLRPVPAPGTPDCRSNDSPTRPQEPPEPGRSQHRSQEFGVTWSTAVGTDAQQALVASGMAFSLPRHLLRHRPAVPPPDWSLPQGRADHLVLSPGCAGTWQGLREHLQHQ